jgi:anaerobic magnesium-protoporphyrin IX monomethyl ester cyclase
VPGVSWRTNGTIHHEIDRPQIEDLGALELPNRDLLSDRSRYRMGAYRVEGIETSRGCPHHCSFCSIRNFHLGRWRPKSVDRVMREVDAVLAKYPEPKVIYFADDNFSTDIRRVEAICKAIVERRTDAYFWCQARADQLSKHPEVIEWMGKAHFAAVLMGIETPNARLLKNTRKGTTIDQVQKAIEMLHQHDVGVWGTFTFGLPGETADETRANAEFATQTDVDVAQITVATPIPGSTLYDDAKNGDQLRETDWDRFDFTSPTMKGQMGKKEMDSIMQGAYLKIYLSKRFLKSLFSKKTNLSRLRRTALSAFSSWIRFAVRARLSGLVGIVAKRRRSRRR